MDRLKSIDIYEKNKEYLFKASNFAEPIILQGKGSFIWDIDGNKYLDLNSGQFCAVFGHDYEPLNQIVTDQMHRIFHTNTMTLTPEILEAAKKVAGINSGDLNKTIFLSTGSEANECAIRYAKFITGKHKIVSLDKGYHGLTLASQSATMGGTWARPRVEGSLYAVTPDVLYKPEELTEEDYIQVCISKLTELFYQNKNSIAAMILEPILGVGGMIFLPKQYLIAVRNLCDEHGVILIFDECQTGFGRTGEWYAYQDYGVIPDMITSAKAMGLGFAVSSVTFKKNLAEQIEDKITHFSSHQNDPLSARIVTFTINEIEQKKLLNRNRKMGMELLLGLQGISEKNDLLLNPRGIGLMCAFDLPVIKVGKDRAITNVLIHLLQEEGIMIQAIRQGITFRVMPNYLINSEEIRLFIDKLDYCMEKLKGNGY